MIWTERDTERLDMLQLRRAALFFLAGDARNRGAETWHTIHRLELQMVNAAITTLLQEAAQRHADDRR